MGKKLNISKEDRPKYNLFRWARDRARDNKTDFSITLDDVEIPTHCPIIGIELKANKEKKQDNSPTLDRKHNIQGYVPGNVWVISSLANTMKSSSTAEERVKFALWVLKTHKNTSSKYKKQFQEALDNIVIY